MPIRPAKLATANAAIVFIFHLNTAAASDSANPNAYLRFGLGLSVFEDTKFKDPDCSASDPPALFGCGNGPDGRSRAGRGNFDENALLEAAVGGHLQPWLDAELSIN